MQNWLSPNHMAQVNWTETCVFTAHLVADLRSCVKFRSRDHIQLLIDDCANI